jgi:predicted O-methyltransferase YrrM
MSIYQQVLKKLPVRPDLHLKYVPSLEPNFSNDADWIQGYTASQGVGQREFTNMNQEKLLEFFSKIKNDCKSIVEIGVHRNAYNDTSTCILLDNKLDDTVYLGIDIEDKSFLNNTNKNIFTLKTDSRNLDHIKQTLKRLNVNEIDFLFIDGWHSVNQVLAEIRLFDLLSSKAIVGFHDVASHPGPNTVFDAIDENIFDKFKFSPGNDHGIGFIIKK